jgi:glyoxylase-like metal-dependent hydrolase (beta-lactamase superfamily II)
VGGGGAADAARTLYATLHERILALPDETVLLPCHYPGGRLAGPHRATLAHVLGTVPQLLLDEDAFVRAATEGLPPKPANYEEIIAVNLGRGDADDTLEVGANNCAVGP